MEYSNSDKKYCDSFTKYIRRKTKEVNIGATHLGADHPIRVQTMTNTDTNNISASVEQCIRCIEAGAEYVRLTAQGTKEAYALRDIKDALVKKGYHTPIVADIHFNPNAALVAAKFVDKVRINPGNYIDKQARLIETDYTKEKYTQELYRLEVSFTELINVCKAHKTALRIGSNHGSLSSRIMSKYGDTPEGMAEAAMEFLRICKKQDFHDVVISMKSSNTRVMVHATRILTLKMNLEGMNYPLHLGVTEAGEGEDGRIKSAVGIGTLLMDGIGETIRVSLTEAPEKEIPVARKIVDYVRSKENHKLILPVEEIPINPYEYSPRITKSVKNIGGTNLPVVLLRAEEKPDLNPQPDYVFSSNPKVCDIHLITANDFIDHEISSEKPVFVESYYQDFSLRLLQKLEQFEQAVLILKSNNTNSFAEQRAIIFELMLKNCNTPVIVHKEYADNSKEDFQLKASVDLGGLCIDGLVDGVWLENKNLPEEIVNETAFSILQASRLRTTKTEYISCPGCGRTLFNLEDAVKKVKSQTKSLTGLKIGVMGCIVNGPGEMADADYGYVGAGPGKIHLYKGKEMVVKNVKESEAVEALIQLIKDNGDWKEDEE